MVAQAQVSVIIPCYRCAYTIDRAVTSVATQTLQPAEVILVDDGSGDGTLQDLHRLQATYPEGWIKVVARQQNAGPGEARNAGWDVATQPYIAFLDADDSWHPQKIEIQYGWMLKHPEIALTGHTTIVFIDQGLTQTRHDPLRADFRPVRKNRILWSNCFSTPCIMLRRKLAMRFAQGKHHSEDYHLWLTIACAGERMARCDLPLAYIHKAPYGASGLSAQLWKMQKGQLDTYRRIRQAGCVSFILYLPLLGWSWARFFRRLVVSRFML